MADQKINELPTKTAPSTGDKMLMIGSAEEYQIDYDQLASAILDKLATKQYSELDTTAKTVLGALDELNGKTIKVERVSYGLNEYDDYSTAVKHYVDTLPNDDSPHICIMTFKSRYLIFAQKYLSGDHSSAFVISYALNSPGYFRKTEGTWKDGL